MNLIDDYSLLSWEENGYCPNPCLSIAELLEILVQVLDFATNMRSLTRSDRVQGSFSFRMLFGNLAMMLRVYDLALMPFLL